MKVLWVDTETTGLSAYKNGVIQISGIVELDGFIVDEFDITTNVFPGDAIEQKALDVNRRTKEEIFDFQPAQTAYKQFSTLLSKYVNKFDKNDKFLLAGYNVGFDADMLLNWFRKAGDKYFYSYFLGGKLDVLSIAMMYCHLHHVNLPNHKLETVATHFGISADFHDAMDDIRATRDLYYKITNLR